MEVLILTKSMKQYSSVLQNQYFSVLLFVPIDAFLIHVRICAFDSLIDSLTEMVGGGNPF